MSCFTFKILCNKGIESLKHDLLIRTGKFVHICRSEPFRTGLYRSEAGTGPEKIIAAGTGTSPEKITLSSRKSGPEHRART